MLGVDLMFDYTESEVEKLINGYFLSQEPLKLREFPSKQKRKYIVLKIIMKVIPDKEFSESELNDILYDIYPDFVTIRRSLIDYKLMDRTKDGKVYWVKKN
jgi:hypothetical protein